MFLVFMYRYSCIFNEVIRFLQQIISIIFLTLNTLHYFYIEKKEIVVAVACSGFSSVSYFIVCSIMGGA